MKQLLNTLFVMTQGAYVHLEGETIRVLLEKEVKLQIPLHHLGSIVCFGNVLVSPFTVHRCAEEGRTLVFLDKNGRFKARLEGPVSGNVLLRRCQYRAADDPARVVAICRNIVAGKVQNLRHTLLRSSRDVKSQQASLKLKDIARNLAEIIQKLDSCASIERIRGIEGEASRMYFEVFDNMILADKQAFSLEGRSRRPPMNRTNALLSFLYVLLLNDCCSALEGVGLDPQVGFLHALRPGRQSLALDLMEEFRPVLADRLALTLVNRRQVKASDFEVRPGNAVYLNENGRKKVVVSYQGRKQKMVEHPLFKEKVAAGLVPHIQARMLARHLRGEMDCYLPFVYR